MPEKVYGRCDTPSCPALVVYHLESGVHVCMSHWLQQRATGTTGTTGTTLAARAA